MSGLTIICLVSLLLTQIQLTIVCMRLHKRVMNLEVVVHYLANPEEGAD